MVKRFDPVTDHDGANAYMVDGGGYGEYVLYEDYVELKDEIRQLKDEIRQHDKELRNAYRDGLSDARSNPDQY